MSNYELTSWLNSRISELEEGGPVTSEKVAIEAYKDVLLYIRHPGRSTACRLLEAIGGMALDVRDRMEENRDSAGPDVSQEDLDLVKDVFARLNEVCKRPAFKGPRLDL